MYCRNVDHQQQTLLFYRQSDDTRRFLNSVDTNEEHSSVATAPVRTAALYIVCEHNQTKQMKILVFITGFEYFCTDTRTAAIQLKTGEIEIIRCETSYRPINSVDLHLHRQ